MPDFNRLTVADQPQQRKMKRKFYVRRAALAAGLGVVVASLFVAMAAFGQTLLGGDEQSASPQSASPQSASPQSASPQSASPQSSSGEIDNLASTEELPNEPINVLVMGVDRRADGSSEELGVRSDTIMIARVYPQTGEVRMLSIPRDFYIEIAPGKEDRINVAYAEGGADRTKAVVENFTGLDVDNYALVDFEGFEAGVDALGGVKVKVRENEYPPGSRLEPGKQKLDGEQALTYARYRYSDGGDLDRIKHQQQIIAALKAKVLRVETIPKLPELALIAQKSVETDVSIGDTVEIVRALAKKDERGKVTTYQLRGDPTVLDDGRQVLMPKNDENQRIIAQFNQ